MLCAAKYLRLHFCRYIHGVTDRFISIVTHCLHTSPTTMKIFHDFSFPLYIFILLYFFTKQTTKTTRKPFKASPWAATSLINRDQMYSTEICHQHYSLQWNVVRCKCSENQETFFLECLLLFEAKVLGFSTSGPDHWCSHFCWHIAQIRASLNYGRYCGSPKGCKLYTIPIFLDTH